MQASGIQQRENVEAYTLYASQEGVPSCENSGRDGMNERLFILDITRVVGTIGDNFISSVLSRSNDVYGLYMHGVKIDELSITKIFSDLLPYLRYMDQLDASHVALSFAAQHHLCRMVNPIVFGYCPILKLNLSRTGLGVKGSRLVFDALSKNITIKELHMNGNGFTNKTVSSLIDFLQNPDNVLEVLGISHNDITQEGVRQLAPVIGRHRYINELYMDGNPITSEGATLLMSSIWKGKMKVLSMSQCSITNCDWASVLLYMTCLESLYIAHNDIDGIALQSLCEGLRRCACIRHLDVSYNALTTVQAGCIGQLMKIHKGLISINMAGNSLPGEVISAIVLGILGNCTLRVLNLTWCDLTIEFATSLCVALAQNSLLHLNLDFNPIPDDMRRNPRESAAYIPRRKEIESLRIGLENKLTTDKLIATVVDSSAVQSSSGGAIAEEEEHHEFAFVDELTAEVASEIWRQRRLEEITKSKKAYEVIVRIREEAENSSEQDNGKSSDEASHVLQFPEDNELQLHIDPGAAAERAKKQLMTSESALIDVIDGKCVLSVSYGRRSEAIGTIEVTELMTYFETRDLIRPLLEKYFESCDKGLLEKKLNFKLIDGIGSVLSEDAEKVRVAWAELSTCGYCLHIQPADWLYIPKDD